MLATHPELFDEIAKELSPYKDIDSLQSVALEQLPLLNAVILETLRLWPPAPSTLARVVPENGVTIGGCYIPAGVSFQPSLY
jgi:cytochrome P450